jgi:ribonuclease PH
MRTATGSALISVGETRVICTASVQEGVPRWMAGKGRGWVTAEYGMLPASTGSRKQREVSRGRPDGRTVEIQRLIGRSLRGVVDFDALGERTIYLDCDVLQADGGTRCASITGAYVALSLACGRLQAEGRLERPALNGSVAGVSCGIIGGAPLLDLDYGEDSAAEVDANVVMTGDGGLVEVQATAERTPLSRAHLDELLALAAAGIEQLRIRQDQAIAEAQAALPSAAATSAESGASGEPSTSEAGASGEPSTSEAGASARPSTSARPGTSAPPGTSAEPNRPA